MGISSINKTTYQSMCEESNKRYWEEYKKKLAKIQRENKKAEEAKKRKKPDKVKE